MMEVYYDHTGNFNSHNRRRAGADAFLFKKRCHMEVFLESAVILNSILVWYLLLHHSDSTFLLAHFTGDLSICFKVDGMGMVFAGLVSALWPFATLYAFEYMEHEERRNTFFAFYLMTYGVTVGIALAGTLVTLYLFYEMLTFVTLPLVMFPLTKEAVRASRAYLYYSIGGAAFAFIGMVFVLGFSSIETSELWQAGCWIWPGRDRTGIRFFWSMCWRSSGSA